MSVASRFSADEPGGGPLPFDQLAWFADDEEHRLLALLRNARVVDCKGTLYGSNDSYLLMLAGTSGTELHPAVYKPQRGETPLWDFPDGSLFRREYAAFITCRALGWKFIPATVIRDGPHGIGTVQTFVPTDTRRHRHARRDEQGEELLRIAAFDSLVNNADRKEVHCLRDYDGRVWAIDHGLTFHAQAKLRTVFSDLGGQSIPGGIMRDMVTLQRREQQRPELRRALSHLLDKQEVDRFFHRLERLIKAGKYPEGGEYYRSHGWW